MRATGDTVSLCLEFHAVGETLATLRLWYNSDGAIAVVASSERVAHLMGKE